MSQMIDFTCRPASRGGRSMRSAVCRRERCGRCCSSPTGWWSSSTAISRWPRTWPPGASLSPATTTWATAGLSAPKRITLLRRTRRQPRRAGGSARCDDPDKAARIPACPISCWATAWARSTRGSTSVSGAMSWTVPSSWAPATSPKRWCSWPEPSAGCWPCSMAGTTAANWWPDFHFWGTTRVGGPHGPRLAQP